MSDNLVLDLLRAIRGDIAEIKADVVELKERIGLLEGATASVSRRLDRLGGDVEQIKRRLDLVSAT
jgi:predicted nuclease with TOPRIM domain